MVERSPHPGASNDLNPSEYASRWGRDLTGRFSVGDSLSKHGGVAGDRTQAKIVGGLYEITDNTGSHRQRHHVGNSPPVRTQPTGSGRAKNVMCYGGSRHFRCAQHAKMVCIDGCGSRIAACLHPLIGILEMYARCPGTKYV